MNIEKIKDKAIAAIALHKFSSDTTKYIDFAFYLISNKIESENIYILAGLENDSIDDKILYFNKVLEDLNIQIDDYVKIDVEYAKSIAKQVINNTIDPVEAATTLERLYLQTDYDPFYIEFLEISDGIDLIREGYELVQGMNESNIKEYIKHTFELFLIFSDLIVPTDFYNQGYCKKCLKRVTPKNKEKRDGVFGKKHIVQLCPECSNANEFYWTRYNQGKDLYLKEIRLTIASS